VRRGAAFLAADPARRPLFHAAVAALAASLVYFLFETPLVWPEAGSLIVILLAVVTRAGCADREREGRPARALAALGALVALLALLLPTWIAYARAGDRLRLHQAEWAAAQQAGARGDDGGRRGHLARAAALLEQADAVFPHRPEVQIARADLLFGQGRSAEALEALREADRRAPGSFRTLNALGVLLVAMERPAEAIEPLRRAIAAHRGPEAAETYLALGRACHATGRHEQAWAVFRALMGPPVWYDVHQPALLLDAVRALIALDRNLHEARPLLALYRERAPQGDAAAADDLERQLDALLARPRRPFHRTTGG
jgi:tetratricopeptide (TPR) repeat protein